MGQKVVYISGGTSGINLGIAKLFASHGAKILIFGRDSAKATAAANEVRALSDQPVMAGSADVRDPEAISTLFSRATQEIGRPNVVIAGAAGNFTAPAVALSPKGFKTVVDIDLLGTYNVFRAGYDLINAPGASMIAITAPQAIQPMAQQVHVCAAKAGVNMVVKVLALEWGPAGIRVNAISPGPIQGTEGVERMAPSAQAKDEWARSSALRRLGTTEDVASAAVFLSSDAASYITGAILNCDGGMSLGDASGNYLTNVKPRGNL
jgi:NAD(P)-dependent dehydrogenase (short-subunit alcohol dehydrogenase family)